MNLCNYELKRKSEPSSMTSLLAVAERLVKRGAEPVEFLVPLIGRNHFDHQTGLPWLARKDFRNRFAELFPTTPIPRTRGGLRLQVFSLDKYSAIRKASKLLTRAEMRVNVSSNRRELLHTYEAWMNPGSVKVDLTPVVPVDFRVPSLDAKGGQLLFTVMSDEIEAAFDLLTGFLSGPERAASVGAWAALESLLADPEDFGNLAEVADRAADILTCRYVTDEFVSLAIGHRRASDDALAKNLTGVNDVMCVQLLEHHIRSGGGIATGIGTGAMMAYRMKRLLDDPSGISNLRADISAAFRRLYQVRNQIVHTGALEPYGFDMIILSAQVLLSALIDKAIVSSRTSGDPVGLIAAKARWSLQRAQTGGSLSLLASV